MAKMIMVIDTVRCNGCHTCAMACKVENNLPNNVWWNQIFAGKVEDFTGDRSTFSEGKLVPYANLKVDMAQGSVEGQGGVVNSPDRKNVTMTFYTKACQHCGDPACLEVCPTGAIYKDATTGAVDTVFEDCIGCSQCIHACPYDVRYLNTGSEVFFSDKAVGGQGINKHLANTVDKCTFCSHRLAHSQNPACVECCPAAARYFGNVYDPTSTVYKLLNSGRQYRQLLPDSGREPSIYFLL